MPGSLNVETGVMLIDRVVGPVRLLFQVGNLGPKCGKVLRFAMDAKSLSSFGVFKLPHPKGHLRIAFVVDDRLIDAHLPQRLAERSVMTDSSIARIRSASGYHRRQIRLTCNSGYWCLYAQK
jgi:hypothetical protein